MINVVKSFFTKQRFQLPFDCFKLPKGTGITFLDLLYWFNRIYVRLGYIVVMVLYSILEAMGYEERASWILLCGMIGLSVWMFIELVTSSVRSAGIPFADDLSIMKALNADSFTLVYSKDVCASETGITPHFEFYTDTGNLCIAGICACCQNIEASSGSKPLDVDDSREIKGGINYKKYRIVLPDLKDGDEISIHLVPEAGETNCAAEA